MDVARKVVILARECGLEMELSDVKVESLVPGSLQQSTSAEAFLEGLPEVQKVSIFFMFFQAQSWLLPIVSASLFSHFNHKWHSLLRKGL